MAGPAPGAEFLERRLARATAVPPAERSPEVAAFVESMQLLREARELLPLTPDGTPALPDTPAAGRKGLYVRFAAYAQLSAAKAVYRGATGELGLILGAYTAALAAHSDLEAARRYNNVAGMLVAPASGESGLQRQMEQLVGSEEGRERLPTVAQLQHSCCNCVVVFAYMSRQERQEQQPTADQLAMLTMAAVASGAAMRQLEPNNPKSHIGQALALDLGGGSQEQVVESFLRAFELGQQQGSDYVTCSGASSALMAAAQHPLEVGHTTLAAALAAFEGAAEAALRRCRRVLPADWLQHLERQVEQAGTIVTGARDQLCLLQQQASGVAGASEALGASVAAQAAAANAQQESTGGDSRQIPHATACDGCGQLAVGLRRCGRCMRAQYCSRECQVAHWAAHTRECTPV